jgi:hypothetical protein
MSQGIFVLDHGVTLCTLKKPLPKCVPAIVRNDPLHKFQLVGFQDPSPLYIQHGTIQRRLNALRRHMLKNQQTNQVGRKP